MNKETAKPKEKSGNDFIEDLYCKKIDSGHTFLSFLGKSSIFVIGCIRDYFQVIEKKDSFEQDPPEIPPESPIEVLFNLSYPLWKIKVPNGYLPFQLSCNKFSMAVLLKKDRSRDNTGEGKGDYKEFSDLFIEIKGSLKAKGYSFQSYFLNFMSNERLYSDNIGDEYNKYVCNEQDFHDKVTDLISLSEKYNQMLDRLINSFRQKSISTGGRIDMLEVYSVLYEEGKIPHTRIILVGEIIKILKGEIKKHNEIYNNWQSLYNKSFVFELPLITLPIKQVEIGDSHVLMLSVDGEVFAFGDGSTGATGNRIRTIHYKPQRVKFPFEGNRIVRIAAGSRHSMALNENSILFSWGYGKNGRLGHGDEKDCFEPRLIDSLSNHKVEAIDAGDNYSACVTQTDHLFSWGSGEFGRLGHGDNADYYIPTIVESLPNTIVNVRCDHYAMVATTRKKEIFLIGAKSLFMRNSDRVNNEEVVPVFNNSENIRKIEPREDSRTLVQASCGYQFISLLSEDVRKIREKFSQRNQEERKSQLYIWGNMYMVSSEINQYFRSIDLITERSLEKYEKIMEVHEENTLRELQEKNSEFDTEEMAKMQEKIRERFANRISTKHEQAKNVDLIKDELMGFRAITDLAIEKYTGSQTNNNLTGARKVLCSDNNTVVLSHDGDLYSFGSYLYKVSTDKKDQYFYPVQPRNTKVLHFGLGSNHILLVTNNYDVYGWGRNKEGQLGLGNTSLFMEDRVLVDKLRNRGIKKIYCSENYSAALSYNHELYLFGDISFQENSEHINYQLSPKEVNWGEIYKIALGPTHILMMSKDSSGIVSMKAIGNGTYGKLGDGNETEDNRYEPTEVDIAYPNHFSETDKWMNTTMRCSRNNSAALIFDESTKKKTLFVWGYHNKSLFAPREMDKIANNKSKIHRNLKDSLVVQLKPMPLSQFLDVDSISLSDTCMYMIMNKNEVRAIGNFFTIFSNNLMHRFAIPSDFRQISVGLDHAAGITIQENKVFTWGYNVMHKLGIKNKEGELDNLLDEEDFNDYDKFLVTAPQSIADLNAIFSAQIKKEEKEELVTAVPTEKETDEEESTKKIQEQIIENTFTQTQKITKDYEKLESELIEKEMKVKETLKNILKKYNFLIEYEKVARNLREVLYNQFNFRMEEKPLNIEFKKFTNSKLPYEYVKHKKNFKALLTTLKIHPCYLANIYKHDLMSEHDLFLVSESLFFNIYDDTFSQVLLIILSKSVFKIHIENNLKAFNENKEANQGKEFLEVYKIFQVESSYPIYSLFANLCRLYFRFQKSLQLKLDLIAMFLVSCIYQKVGSKGTSVDLEKAMYIRSNDKKKDDFSNVISTVINSRIELLFTVVRQFKEHINQDNSSIDQVKDTLFSHTKSKYGPDAWNRPKEEKYIAFDSMTALFIQEMMYTMMGVLGGEHREKYVDYLTRNLAIIIFDRLIEILEEPERRLCLDAQILIDKPSFQNFMKKSKNNFFSVAHTIRYLLIYIAYGDDAGGEDDISKKLLKKFNEIRTDLVNDLQHLTILGIDSLNDKQHKRLDLTLMESYFEHSLDDKNNTINFSLRLLKDLQLRIVANIDLIRVLNKGFDLMDVIFLNPNKEYFIGEDGGLANLPIGLDDDVIIQVNLKTRTLAYSNPSTLMRCQHCKTLLLDEFNLANEELFYDEFQFISKSSKEGCLISVFKLTRNNPLKNDKIIDYLKEELNRSDEPLIKEHLYFMCTLIAVEQRTNLLLDETDIGDPKQLLDIILNDKATVSRIAGYCKTINEKFEAMKTHKAYFTMLENVMESINAKVSEQSLSKRSFRKFLFEKICKNIEKGYGNPDMVKYKNSLQASSKIVQLVKHLDEMPKSKNLYEKLSKQQKSMILPFKEYELRKLINDKVVYSVMLKDCDAEKNPGNFKLQIQKTRKMDYYLTLIRMARKKSGFFACGKDNDSNSTKICTYHLTNDMLNLITKKCYASGSDPFYKIEDFIEVDCRQFVKILKQLTNLGLDS